MINTIYALIDPTTGMARYVGRTSKPLEHRLQGHIHCTMNADKTNWLNGLKEKGLAPSIIELETCEGADWIRAEMFWIEHFKAIGTELLNRSDGGDGRTGESTSHMVRKNFTVTEKHYALLMEESAQRGISMSEIIRGAIEDYMEEIAA